METMDLNTGFENSEINQLDAIRARVDNCMQQYRPYIMHGFSRHHLSVITNIPETDIEIFFNQSPLTFEQYLDVWRVSYAKNLMKTGKVQGMEMKIIGSLSGFSSTRKFIEVFQNIEGISPTSYQSQITTTT